MSLTDLELPNEVPSEDFGRTPPQDVAAEQSVLGGMLLSKDAIADVVEVLRGVDFYRPAHEAVYEAILDLYGRGEPADAVTVAAELTKRGELGRVGGPAYLHTLLSSVPTAANAGYYARIVHERAVLRRLVQAGTKIVQLGYASDGGDVDDIVNAAQAEVYAVTEKRASEDYLPLGEIIEATIDEIEASSHRGDGMIGVPTGFADLDRLTNGLHSGQMIVIAARPAVGKALALDTPIPTPDGWTSMGRLRVGDRVLGADGRPTTVTAATEVMLGRSCYEVCFGDGEVIVADAEHLWLTRTRAGRHSGGVAEVRTTAEIAATLRCAPADPRWNHSVANARPLNLPGADLPVPPYTLGAWLGTGTGAADRRRGPADPEIVARIEAEDGDRAVASGLQPTLGPGDRHLPPAYLRAGERQRREVLAGLLDTGGGVTPSGTLRLHLAGERLARDVQDLVAGLGYRSRLHGPRPMPPRRPPSPVWTLSFATDDVVFGRERLRLLHKERSARRRSTEDDSRWITAVRPVPSVPVRCIQVDSDDHLYLAGRSMIPTHNSTVALDICRSAALHHNLPAVIFSLEMSRTEITMRLLSAEARVPLQKMRKGMMDEDDWTRLARTMGDVNSAPLYIDDSPNMTLMEIRAKCRRLKQRHGLGLVVIDYLQLMTSGKRVESRQQEVSEFSRALKLLAKELEVPVIAVSQLNRGPEQRTDKKPMISDLRESGCLTADTRVLRADTGAETTLGELFATGARDVPVWSLDESLRYVRRHLTHVFATGVREVFRVRLASGKQVRATANHPFLTHEGWTPIGELAPGARLAVPRHVPAPEVVAAWSDGEVRALAQRVAVVADPVPATVHALPKRQVRLFLRELWSRLGTVRAEDSRVQLRAPRPAVLDGVARLLLRFGISVRLAGGVLLVEGGDDQRRFLGEIGVEGRDAVQAARLLARVAAPGPRRHREAASPVWDRLGEALGQRRRLGAVAAVLDQAGLDIAAVNDVVWDEVVAVEADGVEEVYDATVPGTHNFVANGIAVHNSIEQDADVVILLHREDMYEKESPRAGEADFIVAKHRNGPTDTITVAFQGHYSRFVDMAT